MKIERIKEVISKYRGRLSLVAKELQIPLSKLKYIIDNNEELKEYLKDVEEETKDMLELAMLQMAIQNADKDCMKYYLSHKAKERGYGDDEEEHKQFPSKITIEVMPTRDGKK